MERYSSYKDSGEKWLGEIPRHWEMRKMKFTFKERSEKGYPNEPLLAATQNHGVILKSSYENRTVEASKSLESLKLVEVGDFVISLRSFQGGLELAYDKGIISPAYTILKPTYINSGYFKYLAKSPVFISLLKSSVTGIREGQNIDYAKLKENLLPIPPQKEQEKISTYLDSVTGNVDRAIAQSQRMIDLLNERKQIIIQHAVTKGLNPNAKLKNSGVEWIGEMPEGWKCLPVRRVAEVNPTRKKKLSPDAVVGYAPMGYIRNDNMQPLTSLLSRLSTGLTYCETNDIVLAKVTPCFENGNVAIVPKVENDCCFASSEIFVYRCGDKIESRFLLYYFQNKGFIDAGASTMQGTGGLKRVTTEFAKNAFVPLPSLNEQKEIIEYLDDYTKQIKSAIAATERKIALLRERKQIIINEVVTGKVKVS